MTRARTFCPLMLLAAALVSVGTLATAQTLDDGSAWSSLPYRHVGPIGNRISAVAGVPGDANVYLVGAASGGVWKSTDGGVHWRPVFDDQPVQSIGSLAIATSDPNVVWAGTGESFIRSNVVVGNGVYRSTDGGDSWEHAGLAQSGRIGRIIVHPADPDTAWVAALGHLYGPQQERGVYKTSDGGQNWRRVLFVSDDAGAVDLAIDPGNPRVLYAAMWQMQIWTWGRQSGGPGGGIHRSDDGGETWVQLTEGGYPRGEARPDDHLGRGTVRSDAGVISPGSGGPGRGLPGGPLGKIGLATSAAKPARLYALIETSSFDEFAPIDEIGVLWRSDDRGDTWQLVSRDHTLTQRPLYYTRAAVAPDDADEIHFMAVAHTKSLDGGRSIQFVRGSGGDNHDMWIDPLMPDRMIIGHDGGVAISTNRGESWAHPPLPVAQVYHVATDDQIPYFLYGNRQDGPSFRGPSNTLTRGSIPISAWHSVGGCESGWAIPDPHDNNIVWSGCYEGILDRYDHRTGHAQNVSVWPDNPEGWPAGELRYRFQWTFPIALSPHDPGVVYVGSQHVHRSDDGGHSWEVISPDLTTNNKELQQKTGGLTPDDSSPTYAAVLFAIAESRLEPGVIWAGSNDGKLHMSRDGGGTWNDVTANIPELPPLGTISSVEPSRYTAGKAYLAVDLHQVDSTEPQLFRTEDYGATWSRITDGIPSGPLSYTHVLREDPVRPGLLYAGTANALYISLDDGAWWQPLQNNLPHAPVHWLTVQEQFNDLVVSTYGRGFWILDDITPLQQLTDEARARGAYLFEPRAAYRFLSVESPVSFRDDSAAGSNPPYGATLHYWLAPETSAALSLEVINAEGTTVRQLGSLPRQPGINRVVWDLRMEGSRTPRLRTQPLEHEHAELNDAGWRPLVEGGRVAPLVVPGSYTVRLTIGDEVMDARLEVRQDPNSAGDAESIAAQTELLLRLRDDVNTVVDLIDEIEWIRTQIDAVQSRHQQQELGGLDEALETADSLDDELIELEMQLFNLRLTGGSAFQDTLRWPRRLYAKLTSLAGYAGGTDFAPTAQQLEVYERYRGLLAEHQATMDILRGRVEALNGMLEAAGLGLIGGTAR